MMGKDQLNACNKILVTGASGFLGSALVDRLASREGAAVLAMLRSEHAFSSPNVEPLYADLDNLSSRALSLAGVDAIVHCAARVHVMDDGSSDPLTAYRKINVQATLELANQAVLAGVKRFIFISSIKVNGEATAPGKPYTPDDLPAPLDPYGVSKMEAEEQLKLLAAASNLDVVIIRPVLVYGPGVKANFHSMMRWLNKGLPLPLGGVRNQRSLVALDNLVDLIVTCLNHPAAVNQTFLVSDGEDMSTTQLLKRMGIALSRRARLVPVPAAVLLTCASVLGRRGVAQRLCGSLQVDIKKTQDLLGWSPPMSVEDSLRKTAEAFKKA
ncbi:MULTISPECIES: SDR family oxidoreductase [Pseudomonas]|uniref:SDR family oxidoreductase n=2 Tax=Pseudomonas TaxID=286 RepID=A0ABT4WK92_PSEFR|nr:MULTISPECIES: SDR family oxidoreductase [Pseudomonas]MDA7020435.1 SDR family oxidoreductase [Pseudomonas fragi]